MMFTQLLALTLMVPAGGSDVQIVAHRGESADAPENTLAAFRLAWERGVEAIELDVHQAADGALVVIHDADTERTTGVRKIVKESALEDLESLDAGSWKGGDWAGEPIPTLDEALATVPENGVCFVEIKVGPEAVPALVESVRNSGLSPEQVVIISFHADTIAETKRRLPALRAYFLSGFRQDEATGAWSPTVEELIATAREIKADALNVSYRGPIDETFVRKVRDAGLGFYVWTVDDAGEARRLVELGVDGITTNRAAWLREQLEHEAAAAPAAP